MTSALPVLPDAAIHQEKESGGAVAAAAAADAGDEILREEVNDGGTSKHSASALTCLGVRLSSCPSLRLVAALVN